MNSHEMGQTWVIVERIVTKWVTPGILKFMKSNEIGHTWVIVD